MVQHCRGLVLLKHYFSQCFIISAALNCLWALAILYHLSYIPVQPISKVYIKNCARLHSNLIAIKLLVTSEHFEVTMVTKRFVAIGSLNFITC